MMQTAILTPKNGGVFLPLPPAYSKKKEVAITFAWGVPQKIKVTDTENSVPNSTTLSAMKEAKGNKTKRFKTADSFLSDLYK
jgi:hypothetical protein